MLVIVGTSKCAFQTISINSNGLPRNNKQPFTPEFQEIVAAIPIFESDRIFIRPTEYSDMAAVAKLVTDPDVIKLNTGFFS